MKRGRPGRAHLTLISPSATDIKRPLIPFEPLPPKEQRIFSMVAAENPHLRQCDSVTLAAYAKCAVGLRNTDSASDFERLCRTLLAIARSLRISAQSRCHPKTLARHIDDEYVGPRPWDRDRETDDSDNDDEDDKP